MKAAATLLLLSMLYTNGNGQGKTSPTPVTGPSLIVLGNVQDGGSPHIGCTKACCRDLFRQPDPTRMVAALGVVDPDNNRSWLFDATPDLPRQMKWLQQYTAPGHPETPDGIFLTHAHIGHYAGLMYLGREALNTKAVTVYAMPGMQSFLTQNGPWSQLVSLHNIRLQPIQDGEVNTLSSHIKVTAYQVPHRDEFSETVGYRIEGPHKKVLFIPDIDKWSKWRKSITDEIKQVDYAFIDATFFDGAEINNRPIAEIPHPFVIESMALLQALPAAERAKVYFIHLNHTNPLLNPASPQTKTVLQNGFHIARFNQVLAL
ncbi:MBL fold metallo-hydrolase [Chitinophaga nivalis]|uniref:MBL fold metallo-hydrolase n=1 Tax=Chitinophaga nivalis TaxID=2991709 RepID=A0ABT3IPI5_9BACT|nr:MBL fold metallo-hydrolase [Chitinophaga nivalis]MCW3464425.1 MBL fold metallo-hydrolase [Chitinophaga nivalis]MCW3485884.1 MBL fold metallo-hydrolase [Chitinophaga nivalis]